MRSLFAIAATVYITTLLAVTLRGAGPDVVPARAFAPQQAVGARTGEEIFRAACATCHRLDGTGSPRSVIGFDTPPPDFTDCRFATSEADADWQTVVHEGGPIRGLDRHMPAFGDALTKPEIARVVTYLRSFCTSKSWPQGDLNFPRAFFTEKAYPESETVFGTSFSRRGTRSVEQFVEYEHRIGSRGQASLEVPMEFEREAGPWSRGLADVEAGYKHTLFSSMRSGTILSAAAIFTLPTGDQAKGFGGGTMVYEPVVMFGQRLMGASFIQAQAGLEFEGKTGGERSAYAHLAAGRTFAANRGFGRLFTPQVEVLWARTFGEASSWDVVPGIQISLSKLQHVRAAVGARLPLTQRSERPNQLVLYLLWDWADGGFFEFWK